MIEHAGFAKEPLKSGMTARRRVERLHEGVPILLIEREGGPVGKALGRLIQGGFADGLMRGARRGLQNLLCGGRQAEIEFLCPDSALNQGMPLHPDITEFARQRHDKSAPVDVTKGAEKEAEPHL